MNRVHLELSLYEYDLLCLCLEQYSLEHEEQSIFFPMGPSVPMAKKLKRELEHQGLKPVPTSY